MTHIKREWRADHCNVLTDKEKIAECFGGDIKEVETNARLIAAAPLLLEACKLALDIHNREHQKCNDCLLVKRLQKAIKQAEEVSN